MSLTNTRCDHTRERVMRLVQLALLTLTLSGCSGDSGERVLAPTKPNPPAESSSLWVMVTKKSGECIVPAYVAVVRGQGLGQAAPQYETCSMSHDQGGVKFQNLRPGDEMTILASASGYASREVTVVPGTAGPSPLLIELPSASEIAWEVSTLSGVAYEHTAAESRPLAGLPLRVHGMTDRRTSVTVDVVTDAAGRYEVAGLARESVMVGAVPQDAYLSPCSERLWVWNDEPVNVHVVSRATLLSTGTPTSMPPFLKLRGPFSLYDVLSGFITERTPEGVRPVSQASVEHLYGDGRSGDPTGFTLTNAEGYYALCGYWDDYGQAVRVRKDGYKTGIQSIGPSWRIDVELVRDNAG